MEALDPQRYRDVRCIHDGRHSTVFRAHCLTRDVSVVVKQPRGTHRTARAEGRFAREFEITRQVEGDGVVRALELVTDRGAPAIVLEDGGRSLASVYADERPPLALALRIAVQVTTALARIHRKGIVHKDVNPANIVWDSVTATARLIDFGLAQVLDREQVGARPIATFEGTAAYASPEQTGRMNRQVDRRSDLYSLGATLYRLVVGRPPFESTDRLELVHAHLAKTAIAPRAVDLAIPEAISDIVMALLEKRAEDRYQSADGLLFDLEACRRALETGGFADRLVLRGRDVDLHLRIPEKLYGRADAVARLLRAFAEAAAGRTRALLVSGEPGIGKTSLVRELLRAPAGRGAVFAEGKFDQFDRATPYDGVIQALRGAVRAILAEDESLVARARERILAAARGNGRVLTDVIPELDHVVGHQPAVEPLPPAEARNRFRLAMAGLVPALAAPDHPLVVFLDDLQWADLPSIELVQSLVTDPESRHVFVVGAFRDGEVGPDHPLAHAIAQLRARSSALDEIALGPLGEDDVLELVTDTVGTAPGRVRLAVACHAKTRGNAFFLKRFLEALFDAGLLTYDAAERRWSWDQAAIQARPMTDNVVDFLAAEIGRLAPEDRRTLQVASCLGDHFDLATLADATGASCVATAERLRSAFTAEFVRPLEEGFWFAPTAELATADLRCAFVHDRVRQAARAGLDEATAASVHLRAGRRLLSTLGETERRARLFEIVEHFGRAAALLRDPAEIQAVAALDLEAARRATAAAAFAAARDFYRRARAALASDRWERDYPLALALHVEGARAEWLAGDHEAMEALVATATVRARSVLDRVTAEEVRIQALVSRQRFGEAVARTLAALAALGVRLNATPSVAEVGAEVLATKAELDRLGPAALAALPANADPTVAAVLRIENGVMSSVYLSAPLLLPLVACSIVRQTIAHGVCAESPYGFVVLGLVLNAMNRCDEGHATGQIALAMLEALDARAVAPRTLHVLNCHVNPFVALLRASLDGARRVHQLGMEVGDLEYAAWGLHMSVCYGFYAGVPLAELGDTAARHLATMRRHEQMPPHACTAQYAQAIACLAGRARDPARLAGPDYDEDQELATLGAVGFKGAAFITALVGAYVRYLFRDLAGATERAARAAPFADGATSTYHPVWWRQYRALARLALIDGVNAAPEAAAAARNDVDADLAQLRVWHGFAPANHAHRLNLVLAELARVEGRRGDAADLYDRAIADAGANGFTHEEALGNELAGRFHLARGAKTAARAYLSRAGYDYERWGASAKVAQLEAEFAGLLTGVERAPVRDPGASTSSHGSSAGDESSDIGLDLATLFKAAHSISSEVRLPALLARVLEVAIENAGATRGYLVVERAGALFVEAARDAQGHAEVAPGVPVEACEGLPVGVVAYVARTGESLVLADVREDPRWRGDPRVARRGPTSILCAPMSHRGARSGIVYLENDLTAGAFTRARTRLVELLATQAAISIENVTQTDELRSHRDRLEDLVRERTRELDHALARLTETNVALDRLSLTDALTGLPNRRDFDRTLEGEWSRARRERRELSLVMIDVDCFKRYNDHHGHAQGDECLRQVARRIGGAVARATDHVSRYGGEEFAAILPGTGAVGARDVAQAMIAAVAALGLPHAASTVAAHVTISCGCATLVPNGDLEARRLVELADRGLYRAKEAGRNRLGIGE